MKKIVTFFYNFFKIKYFRLTRNINEIFLAALNEVYKNPFMLRIYGIEVEDVQIGNESSVIVNIATTRPGLIIGFQGKDMKKLEALLSKYWGDKIEIKIHEIK